jgi:hypothetical protein
MKIFFNSGHFSESEGHVYFGRTETEVDGIFNESDAWAAVHVLRVSAHAWGR